MLDSFLLKNPLLRFLDRHDIMSTFPVVTFARARMNERLREIETLKEHGIDNVATVTGRHGDLLSTFLKIKEDRPAFFHNGRVLTMAVSMAFAGSETTAISLSAIFYYLLKNRSCYVRLMEELDEAVNSGMVENRPNSLVTWAESQKLTYLDACIKEAFRLHPAAGLPLERVVPACGMEICGQLVPGGTIVGCSAWVIHRRPEIFGKDVEIYRPERWLEANKESKKSMEGCMIHFGMGPRTCIGKNISLLEIYKLVPSFLRRFEVPSPSGVPRLLSDRRVAGLTAHPSQVNLANLGQEWRLHNAWFVKQLDFNTTFRPRS